MPEQADQALLAALQHEHGLRAYKDEDESRVLLFMRDALLAELPHSEKDARRLGLWALCMASRADGCGEEAWLASSNAMTCLYAAEEPLCRRDLSGMKLAGARLKRANLDLSDLSRCVLRGADLSQAWLCRAVMREADLTDAVMGPVQLQGHSSFVTSVCFSLVGRALASGSRHQNAMIWDMTDVRPLPHQGSAGDLAGASGRRSVSHDGGWTAEVHRATTQLSHRSSAPTPPFILPPSNRFHCKGLVMEHCTNDPIPRQVPCPWRSSTLSKIET